jgi:hypothetical protein
LRRLRDPASSSACLPWARPRRICSDLDGGAEIELDHGRDEPTRLGWTYTGDRERLPIWTATLCSRAANTTMTAALSLGESGTRVTRAGLESDHAILEASAETVEVRFEPGQAEASVQATPSRRRLAFDQDQ